MSLSTNIADVIRFSFSVSSAAKPITLSSESVGVYSTSLFKISPDEILISSNSNPFSLSLLTELYPKTVLPSCPDVFNAVITSFAFSFAPNVFGSILAPSRLYQFKSATLIPPRLVTKEFSYCLMLTPSAFFILSFVLMMYLPSPINTPSDFDTSVFRLSS